MTQPQRRVRVGVWFGGRSPEHWVSLKSGLFVLVFLDRSRFDVAAHYVRPDGSLAPGDELVATIDRFLRENTVVLFHPHEQVGNWRERLDQAARDGDRWADDVVFPVFHGRYGEDGTAQGLAESLHLPYVGCNFSGSVLGMDKVLTKKVVARRGLAIAPFVEANRQGFAASPPSTVDAIVDRLGLPVFVKPARLGSSIGVSRAVDRDQVALALAQALEYDEHALIEQEIRGIEYAVGVLGRGDEVEASVIVEYQSSPEVFDYDSKYGPQSLDDIIPARLSPEHTAQLQRFSCDVFRALKMEGICRVDSFWGPQGPILNEVNTMPGLNALSPFVQAWRAAGWPPGELLGRMVDLALGVR